MATRPENRSEDHRAGRTFAAYLFSRRPLPAATDLQVTRRALRGWMPPILLVMALAAEPTMAGIASRLIVIAFLVSEWLRLAGRLPALGMRFVLVGWLGLLALAFGLSLSRLHPLAVWLVPAFGVCAAIVVHVGYLRWRAASLMDEDTCDDGGGDNGGDAPGTNSGDRGSQPPPDGGGSRPPRRQPPPHRLMEDAGPAGLL